VPERLTSELVALTPAPAVADSLTPAATIPSRRADEWSQSWPLTGFGGQVAADILGHLGPKAPGAYSVYRMSLHSNGALCDIKGLGRVDRGQAHRSAVGLPWRRRSGETTATSRTGEEAEAPRRPV
jgi:hypothetical protein